MFKRDHQNKVLPKIQIMLGIIDDYSAYTTVTTPQNIVHIMHFKTFVKLPCTQQTNLSSGNISFWFPERS